MSQSNLSSLIQNHSILSKHLLLKFSWSKTDLSFLSSLLPLQLSQSGEEHHHSLRQPTDLENSTSSLIPLSPSCVLSNHQLSPVVLSPAWLWRVAQPPLHQLSFKPKHFSPGQKQPLNWYFCILLIPHTLSGQNNFSKIIFCYFLFKII